MSERVPAGWNPGCPGNLLIIPPALASSSRMEEPGHCLLRKLEESNLHCVSGFYEDATGAEGSVLITPEFTSEYLPNKLIVQGSMTWMCGFLLFDGTSLVSPIMRKMTLSPQDDILSW